ncbi:hypothetical protein JG688_00011001 [Phytophthora aleatoria]|uniref:Uncharacterized protein n=1 Tax=Phytophthora aleatoria TaxID=2496075 RepID=A0A8J5IDE2_9STRA|nr:hypothetical protein JG688_00011001 [Phytophthora aleatoria]
MMDKLASEARSSSKKCDDPNLFGLLMMMDERQSAREAELRREQKSAKQHARNERVSFGWRWHRVKDLAMNTTSR